MRGSDAFHAPGLKLRCSGCLPGSDRIGAILGCCQIDRARRSRGGLGYVTLGIGIGTGCRRRLLG